jgi:hypothetical protein
MPEFLAETYTPRDTPGTAAADAGDLARFLGAILVPGEETGFWLYQGPTADAVRAAMAAAGLRPERITAAVTIWPSPPARPGRAAAAGAPPPLST